MNKIKFYINIIDVIVCFIRIYLYFCIINEDDMNEVKKGTFAPDDGKRNQASDLYRIAHTGRTTSDVRNSHR